MLIFQKRHGEAKVTKFRVIPIIFTAVVMGHPDIVWHPCLLFILPVTFPVKEQDKIQKLKERLVDNF